MNGAFESSSMFVLGEVARARLKIELARARDVMGNQFRRGGYMHLSKEKVEIRARAGGRNLVCVLTLSQLRKRAAEREGG